MDEVVEIFRLDRSLLLLWLGAAHRPFVPKHPISPLTNGISTFLRANEILFIERELELIHKKNENYDAFDKIISLSVRVQLHGIAYSKAKNAAQHLLLETGKMPGFLIVSLTTNKRFWISKADWEILTK